MLSQESDSGERTAFREAEKKYQQHFEQVFRHRKGRLRGTGVRSIETDLSEVIDFRDPKTWRAGTVRRSHTHEHVYFLSSKPGFCFIAGEVSQEEQQRLITDSLTRFLQGPAATNHSRQYGELPDLWEAAQAGQCLTEAPSLTEAGPPEATRDTADAQARWCWAEKEGTDSTSVPGVPAQKLLEKLRWACLGPNFDWTRREYRYRQPYLPLPPYLADIARRCAAFVGGTLRGVEYEPDAALVNFYGHGDTLGGHRDDVEADLTLPIVSISLGCDAIFLLGGLTKAEVPDALLVRSGDVIVLGGHSRQCFHGMPRILSDRPAVLPELCSEASGKALADFVTSRRINISVRQTA